jgi:dTDP-glucose 4,6-dehydratase
MTANALNDKPLPVYGDGFNIRDGLCVEDRCEAIDVVMTKGVPRQVYNIGGNNEKRNIDIVKLILAELDKPQSMISFVKDRPGHHRRYAIDAEKIKRGLGWGPKAKFEEGIQKRSDGIWTTGGGKNWSNKGTGRANCIFFPYSPHPRPLSAWGEGIKG